MNKTALKILVGFVALALAACAAFFSIVGLSKLFAGAMLAVIAMASTLEISKLVIASYLYQQEIFLITNNKRDLERFIYCGDIADYTGNLNISDPERYKFLKLFAKYGK